MVMQKNKLRVGLLLDGTELAAWEYRMIEILKESDYAEISLIVQNTAPPERRQLTLARTVVNDIRSGEFWNANIRKALNLLERVLVGKPGCLPNASRKLDA